MVLFPPPFYIVFDISNLLSYIQNNWASEASPTLGCSIEISRDIYVTGFGKTGLIAGYVKIDFILEKESTKVKYSLRKI